MILPGLAALRSDEDVLRDLRRLDEPLELLERDLNRRFLSRDLDLQPRLGDQDLFLARLGDLIRDRDRVRVRECDLETLPLGLLDGDLLLASNLLLPVFRPYLPLNGA
jgi:hypothetical protein